MIGRNRQGRIFIATVLVASLLTGCGTGSKTVQVSRPTLSHTETTATTGQGQLARLSYLSEDVCVIPKEEQSSKKSDKQLTAGATLIIDDTDDTMLFGRGIYKKMYPASITKIVTALVTLKYGNLEDMVTVSHDAANITEYGAKLCGFQEGDQIDLQSLLYSFLIYSGNDAGVAIADHMAGSTEAFADMMNQEMQKLGATGSHFVNPHGLHDDDHYTTAYDLYLVFHALLQYDTFLDIIHQSSFTASYEDAQGNSKQATFTSTDRFLTGGATAPEGVTVIGGKTGTTSDAGSCLILYSQDSNGKDYISVVLKAEGAESLYQQMTRLLTYIPT